MCRDVEIWERENWGVLYSVCVLVLAMRCIPYIKMQKKVFVESDKMLFDLFLMIPTRKY